MSLRNVGAGMAVIHGWHAEADLQIGDRRLTRPVETFRPQSRDLYVPPTDSSFWQGAFREDDPDELAAFGDVIGRRERFTIELLYGDLEGGQRTISRFSVVHFGDDGDPSNWIVSVIRHWNLDRVDPR